MDFSSGVYLGFRNDTTCSLYSRLTMRLLISLIGFVTLISVEKAMHVPEKTNVGAIWNLLWMAKKTIPCGLPIFPLPYGCWCGVNLGPEDETLVPINDFDAACKVHDHCYDATANSSSSCASYHEYATNYHWKIDENKEIVCLDDVKDNPCARKYCDCDRTVISTLAKLSKEQGCQKHWLACKK